jgi:hypothetical protein
MSLLGLTKIGYPRGGPMGVFFGSFVVACIWRYKKIDGLNSVSYKPWKQLLLFSVPTSFTVIRHSYPSPIHLTFFQDKVCDNFTKLWFIFQPLLFGIIGSRIDFTIVDWSVMGRGAICLAISITVSNS